MSNETGKPNDPQTPPAPGASADSAAAKSGTPPVKRTRRPPKKRSLSEPSATVIVAAISALATVAVALISLFGQLSQSSSSNTPPPSNPVSAATTAPTAIPVTSAANANAAPTAALASSTALPSPSPIPLAAGAFDLTIIYGEHDSLTILTKGETHLVDLTLETTLIAARLTESFNSFAGQGFIVAGGMCLRYIRAGTQPGLPRGCTAGTTLESNLQSADVFWYDDRSNQYLDIVLKQAGRLIGLCPHAGGSGRCDFSG